MKHMIPIILALLLAGCGTAPAQSTELMIVPTESGETTLPAETLPPPTLPPEEALLAGMTLRQKVGQLFIVRPDALDPGQSFAQADDARAPGVTELSEALRQTLDTYPVGGFIQFSKNIESPEQLLTFNTQLSQALPIAPFLAVDEEGGTVARLAGHPAFDLPEYRSAGSVGAESGAQGALDMGLTIGSYLREYGFNMDFAPVADVNTNPANPVIGNRAFSSDPVLAADCARAMADGLDRQQIIPVFKHFPGHGDTAEDSHAGLAVSHKKIDDMLACEWLPFLRADSRDCIMVGHIALPEVTGDLTPATLSYPIVGGLLRQHLGFEGLIITDSLSMGAILQSRTPAQAALEALEAGCDLLLMPQSLPEAFDAVLEAVEDGSIPQYRLDETVLRILRFKMDHGILPS